MPTLFAVGVHWLYVSRDDHIMHSCSSCGRVCWALGRRVAPLTATNATHAVPCLICAGALLAMHGAMSVGPGGMSGKLQAA